jgi:hypothetical protein
MLEKLLVCYYTSTTARFRSLSPSWSITRKHQQSPRQTARTSATQPAQRRNCERAIP